MCYYSAVSITMCVCSLDENDKEKEEEGRERKEDALEEDVDTGEGGECNVMLCCDD